MTSAFSYSASDPGSPGEETPLTQQGIDIHSQVTNSKNHRRSFLRRGGVASRLYSWHRKIAAGCAVVILILVLGVLFSDWLPLDRKLRADITMWKSLSISEPWKAGKSFLLSIAGKSTYELRREQEEDTKLLKLCSEAVVDHSGDAAKVETLRALMAPLAINNTVIVTPVNDRFLDLAYNLLCRLRALGTTNILFWALDETAARELSAREIPNFFDADLYSVSGEAGYYDEGYIRMMMERPRVWWRMLKTGINLLFLDADVAAFRRPEEALPVGLDLVAQMDGLVAWDYKSNQDPFVCAGAWRLKSSNLSLQLMDRLALSYCHRDQINATWLSPRWDDQIALNWVLRGPSPLGVRVRALPESPESDGEGNLLWATVPPSKILPGHFLKDAEVVGEGYTAGIRKAEAGGDPFTPALIHLNGVGALARKVNQLQRNGWWELDFWGRCRKRS